MVVLCASLTFPLYNPNLSYILHLNSHLNSYIKHTYIEKYADADNEYRHVILPKELSKTLPKSRLLTEQEWRGIGVQQSRGWQHYAIHRPEPHILLFRRRLGTDPQTGKVDPALQKQAQEQYEAEVAMNTRK